MLSSLVFVSLNYAVPWEMASLIITFFPLLELFAFLVSSKLCPIIVLVKIFKFKKLTEK